MFDYFGRSIPRRILASLVAIYLVTYAATAIVVYSSVRESILTSNASALTQLANLKYERLANALDALSTDVTVWSQLEVMNDLVSGDLDKRVERTFERFKRLYKLAGEIYAFDVHDRLLASTANTPLGTLPAVWQRSGNAPAFLDKHRDPAGEGDIIALEVPVFASFGKELRIGTLVLTYPWQNVERLLFSPETGTLLVRKTEPPSLLAADVTSVGTGIDLRSTESWNASLAPGLIVGRSVPRGGILDHWEVRTLEDATDVALTLRHVILELVLLGALLAIPILALGRWLSNRLTAPVIQLTRVVREIADTDRLDARVPVSSSDELGTLARSFNRMTENLERTTNERERVVHDLEALNETLETKVNDRTADLKAAVVAQHRLIGDISHEIKSPLARLDVALGLARRAGADVPPKQFDRMEKEIGNISALAGELLTLARLDSAAPAIRFAEVDLCGIIRQIVANATYEVRNRQDDVVFREPPHPIIVDGNADLLRRAIENIVRNALFYTMEGTPVTVDLWSKNEDMAVVLVSDEGPGVPADALDHLFEPFYRVDEARARNTGGSGVGLAICQRVVALHGGTASARRNQPSGLIVEIDIRLAGSQPRPRADRGSRDS